MKQLHTGAYPSDWRDIAQQVKEQAGWRCVRCGHPHDPAAYYALTVHHLTCDKGQCAWWNLAPLCARCHLSIQGKVIMARQWYLPHSAWFKPFAAGYYAYINGLPDDRDYVMANLDRLLAIGQGLEVSA